MAFSERGCAAYRCPCSLAAFRQTRHSGLYRWSLHQKPWRASRLGSILWAAFDFIDGRLHDDAACIECSGYVPKSETTTNNRVEIAAVLAVLSIAPPDLPLTIYSDSEYVINVAQGIYQMRANTDLW